FAKDFPAIDQDDVHITLVEASPQLFGMFKQTLRTYAEKALTKRGVDVVVGEFVESITDTRVMLMSGTVLDARTLSWGAGLQAHPLAHSLQVELQRGDRVPVAADLSLPEHPDVFVVADT